MLWSCLARARVKEQCPFMSLAYNQCHSSSKVFSWNKWMRTLGNLKMFIKTEVGRRIVFG